MENKLSAPVGDPKCKSPKPGNKPKDIATIELWVMAQGASYKMTGKMNPQLLKWIKVYQGSKGKLKECNGVIEPGDKTWNAGATKYFRYRDVIANFEGYEVVEKGKKKVISVDEYIRLQIDTRTKIINNAKAVQSEADVICKLIQELLERSAGSEGLVNAFVNLGMQGFGLSPPPSKKNALDARAAAGMVISATDRSKVDWAKVKTLVVKADKLHKKAVKEWKDYNDRYIKRAEWGAFGATVVSEGAFAVLEVLATGYLVTTRGMDPKRAQVLAATGVEGLKVSAGEVGEYAANDKFDPAKSAQKVATSMLITGAANAIGGKLSGKSLDKMMTNIATRLTSQFNTRAQKAVLPIIHKILSGPKGAEAIKSAVGEMGNLAKDAADGKKIDEKRVIQAISNSVFGTLLGCSEVKALKKFDNTWQNRSLRVAQQEFQPILSKKLSLKLVAKNPKGTISELMSKEGANITQEATKKMADLIYKQGYAALEKHVTGKETNEEQIKKVVMKNMVKDAALVDQMLKHAEAIATEKLKKLEEAK